MCNIITKQLANTLPQKHGLLNKTILDGENFKLIYKTLQKLPKNEIKIFDITNSPKHNKNELINVKDHINQTGSNILIGNQNKIDIDFPDLSNIYTDKGQGITTICCGHQLLNEKQYPSTFLCNISIIAKILNFKYIFGYLYNIKK